MFRLIRYFWDVVARRRRLAFQLAVVFSAALLVQGTARQALGRVLAFSYAGAVWGLEEERVLSNSNFPGGRVVEYIRNETPEGSRYLIYRQAEFAYYLPDRSWIYDFDPKIIDFYALETPESAFNYMQAESIDYVFVPNYMPATLYNSQMVNVIGDPALATELIVHEGFRLYRLNAEPRAWECVNSGMLAEAFQTQIGARTAFQSTSQSLFDTGQPFAVGAPYYAYLRRAGLRPNSEIGAYGARAIRSAGGGSEIYMRWPRRTEDRVMLVTGEGPTFLPPSEERLDRNQVQAVNATIEVRGEGYVEAWLWEYTADGGWGSRRIFDAVVQTDEPQRFEMQGSLHPETRAVRLIITNGGAAAGAVTISDAQGCLVSYSDGLPDERAIVGSRQNVQLPTSALEFEPNGRDLLAEAIESQDLTLALGGFCSRLSWFCPVIRPPDPDAPLLMQIDSASIELSYPDSGGFYLFMRSPDTGPMTWAQCRASQRIWLLDRFPFRDGTIVRLERDVLSRFTANEPTRASMRLARLEVDVDVPFNSVITAFAHWDRPGFGRACAYLGPVTVSGNDTASWEFEVPVGVNEIEPVLTYGNDLSNSGTIRISSIQVAFED